MTYSATTTELMTLSPTRAERLNNCTCVYCGALLTEASRSREHVIGRRFVPRGLLDGGWNLIVNACRPCNARKANLEDDISAITLQPDAWGRYGHTNAAAMRDAQRKGRNARSRRTRLRVSESAESICINAKLGPDVTMSLQYRGPPQIDQDRAFELARLQLSALFYMQTYDTKTRRGGFWRHGYYPVLTTPRSDWGNSVMRAFMGDTAPWDVRLLAITADGFFKAITRKHPSADTWAWAVEWNHSSRVVGFFGELDPAKTISNDLPRLTARGVYRTPSERLAYRREISLSEEDDSLFDVPA